MADPRLKDKTGYNGSPGLYGVNKWDGPAKAITGGMRVPCSNTPAAIADPRRASDRPLFDYAYRILRHDEPAGAVTGGRGSCGTCVADVRLKHDPRPGVYRILRMDETAPTVVGAANVGTSNGPQAVADHRLGCTPRSGSYGVQRWEEPSAAIVGAGDIHAFRGGARGSSGDGRSRRTGSPSGSSPGATGFARGSRGNMRAGGRPEWRSR